MSEMIIPKNKRFVPMAEYQRISGLSYATVRHLIKTGQIRAIQTEAGHFKIDTMEAGADNSAILEKLEAHEKMLRALCRQFNTAVNV